MDPAPISAKDVFLKRNTDCIYFLASPLTCKKGTKCEFRHSESARFNLRDCYYWLNGNCLNPKCAFRHPPVDGLLEHATIPSQLPFASKQIPTAHSAATTLNKLSSSCIYFKRGNCLKADKCPFPHVAQKAIPQNVAKSSPLIVENQEALNKESWRMKQLATTQQNISKPSTHMVSNSPVLAAKPINGFSHLKILPPKSSTHMVSNQMHQTRAHIQPSVKQIQNGLKPGEIANHYYTGLGAHLSLNDVTIAYEENHIECNGKVYGYHERKLQRISSDAKFERPMLPQRRGMERRNMSLDDMSLSDLRQRLKQRKFDCSGTTNRYRVSTEGSRSSRLNGRISVPGKEREVSRGRVRLSPIQRYGRIRRSSEEPPFPANSRNVSSRFSKRDAADSVNFSGPKSLAELKEKKKLVESSQMQNGSVKKEVGYEETVETCPTFEGPKPLSVLLKRKRGEGSANSNGQNEINRINGEEEIQNKVDDNVPEKEDKLIATQDDSANYEDESLVKEDEFEEDENDYMENDGGEDADLENYEVDYEEEYDANENVYGSKGEDVVELTDAGDDNDDEDEEFARKIGLVFS